MRKKEKKEKIRIVESWSHSATQQHNEFTTTHVGNSGSVDTQRRNQRNNTAGPNFDNTRSNDGTSAVCLRGRGVVVDVDVERCGLRQ